MRRARRASTCAAALVLPVAVALAATARGEAPSPASEAAARAAGLALRAALDAAPAERDAKLAALALSEPRLADHLLALRVAYAIERDAAAAATLARERAATVAQSPLRDELHELTGDALAASGDGEGALAAWRQALDETRLRGRRERVMRRIARAEEQAGRADEAGALWLVLWRDHPGSEAAREAEVRLDAIERSVDRSLRTAADHRARGTRLAELGENAAAVLAFDEALQRGLGEVEAAETRLARAHALFRLRRYEEAERAFAALAPLDEARLFRARSLARAGDVPRAIEALRAIAEDAAMPARAQARWYAALLLDDEPDGRPRARALFAAVAGQSDDASLVPQALWRLGWSAFREARFDEARAELARMASVGDPVLTLQARYWSARAAERAGQAELASRELRTLAGESPLTYYGFRARERLGAEAPPPQRIAAPAGPIRLDDESLFRPRALLAAALADRASREVRRLSRRASASAGDRLRLAALLAETGEAHGAQRLALAAFGSPPVRLPVAGDQAAWRLLWPRAFEGAVQRATQPLALARPALVWSIMREESGFDPKVVSSAGARGLLQLMPDTAERLAREAELSHYDARDLFDPDVNVRLGALYLERLSRSFAGRHSATIASYNAGPEPVRRWLEARGEWPDDEWVEAIPYDQTRGYVKRVMRSLSAYEQLP